MEVMYRCISKFKQFLPLEWIIKQEEKRLAINAMARWISIFLPTAIFSLIIYSWNTMTVSLFLKRCRRLLGKEKKPDESTLHAFPNLTRYCAIDYTGGFNWLQFPRLLRSTFSQLRWRKRKIWEITCPVIRAIPCDSVEIVWTKWSTAKRKKSLFGTWRELLLNDPLVAFQERKK